MLVTDASNNNRILNCIVYIYNSICLQKNCNIIKTLINFSNKINIISLTYILKFGI